MRLLDLIEQDHRIRPTPHRLSQLAALLVADVPGRGTDEPGHGELLAVLAHVDAHEGLLVVEQVLGERLRELRLADTGRPEEQERARRPVGVGDPGTRAAHRLGDCGDGILLADQALAQFGLEVQKLLGLTLGETIDRDARPRRHHAGDVLLGDLIVDHARADRLGGLRGHQRGLDLGNRLVVELGRLLVVALAHRAVEVDASVVELGLQVADTGEGCLLRLPACLQCVELLLAFAEVLPQLLEASLRRVVLLLLERELLDAQPVDGALELVDLGRAGVDLHLQPRRCLVDQVDGLVGQLASGDVPVAERRRRDQRGVGDRHLVVRLVALLESAQDRDGVFDARLPHEHLLEPALQRGILLDVLAVLVERGRTDEAQLAAREHGLQHVRCRDRALAAARAHEGVQLVDEGDDLPVGVVDLLEHGLESLLELAAVLRAGHECGKVERHELLVLERVGDVAGDYALGESLDDGGLADAGLADEHGVVLGAASQHLAHAADLGVTPDHRVELAAARDVGEIHAVLLKRGLLLFVGAGGTLHVGHQFFLDRVTVNLEVRESSSVGPTTLVSSAR